MNCILICVCVVTLCTITQTLITCYCAIFGKRQMFSSEQKRKVSKVTIAESKKNENRYSNYPLPLYLTVGGIS